MKNVAAVSNLLEVSKNALDFASLGRLILQGKGDPVASLKVAQAQGASERVVDLLAANVSRGIIKTAVLPGSTTGSGSGSEIAQLQALVSGFISSLRNVGIFDRLYPDMNQFPLRVKIGSVSVGVSGGIPGQAGVAPLSSMTLVGNTLEVTKAQCIISVTDELARATGPEGAALFSRELKLGCALSTDQEFLRLVASSISASGSSGTTEAALRVDLGVLFGAMGVGAQSKLYIVTTPAIAIAWSFKIGDTNFLQGMSPQGGSIQNVPVIVSDAVPSGYIYGIDANAIAAGSGPIELDTSREADLIMQSSPDSPSGASTVSESLWAHNKIGLRCTRYFGAQMLRSTGIAAISGVSY